MRPQREVDCSTATSPGILQPTRELIETSTPGGPLTFNDLHDTSSETSSTSELSSSSIPARSPDSRTYDWDDDQSTDSSTSRSNFDLGADAASENSSMTEYSAESSSDDGMPELNSASDSEDEDQYGIRLVQTTPEDFEIDFPVFDDAFWNVEGRVYEIEESLSNDSNVESSNRANGSTISDLNTAEGEQ